MLKQGKIYWLYLVGLAAVVVVLGLVFAGGQSPQTRAQQFMTALADGNAKRLAELSFSRGRTQADLEKMWAESVEEAKYYRFKFKILSAQEPTPETAQVRMQVWRGLGAAYEDNFQLDMQKVDGEWKVRLEGLSRDMYPFLPR